MKRPPTKFDRMLDADPVNPVWGSMCSIFLGAVGAISSVGDRFLSVSDPTDKRFLPQKIEKRLIFLVFIAVPTSLFSSKTERFWPPGAPHRGRVHWKDLAVFSPPAGEQKIPARPISVLD